MEFKSIVKSLYTQDNVNNHICATNDVFNKTYIVKDPIDNPYVIVMQRYSGHSTARSKEIGEFYAIYSKDRKFKDMSGYFNELNKITTKSGTRFLRFYINLNTPDITYNFWKYTHTYFFTTCLLLSKTTLDLISGTPLAFVPWFDFQDKMFNDSIENIDISLFKKYGITQKFIDYITSLSNYYSLDLSKYTL
ncbi:MAG: hypothetical protein [Wendovervirus sonii]|uniref:Uncharacterized protein n=1 Tax=phage Lak_Megaphage_Sonny TaxID=3109229 RepID=A0ABZ0Z449_9CAUD|nr:MAG: hypothetical protein [phage Lak_Megaphage_Sonny]